MKELLSEILGNFDGYRDCCGNSQYSDEIISLADKALRHEFDILGSGAVKLEPINWHLDFKSGFCWEKGKFYKDYKKVDYSNNSDVKVPWELSRCHHLLWLGEAYLLTDDEKYAKEIVFQIENWIDENPLMYSINWTCAMDVAIRAINWLYALNMIIKSDSVTDTFVNKFVRSLYEHGFFIFRNLEKCFPYSANHYAADITGLLFIGRFFLDTKEGGKWWKFALQEYFNEVRSQILPSGVHFERSTSYHRLMTELFFYSYLLLKRHGIYIPTDIQYRVKSMFDFILNYTRPDGKSPIIGDNDDGRLLPFVMYPFNDHRYLLGVAASNYSEPLYKKYSSGYYIDSFFLLNGMQEDFDTIVDTGLELSSKSFDDAGFFIIRHKDIYMFISNSDLSGFADTNRKTYGTHTHADLLSFELVVGDTAFIVDSGSYVYTSSIEYRNRFRGTSSHNTVEVDGFDQHNLSQNAFRVSKRAMPLYSKFIETDSQILFEGSHSGYKRLDRPVLHKRCINLNKKTDSFSIKDELEFNGRHNFCFNFNFATGVAIESFNDTIIAKSDTGKTLILTFDCECDIIFDIADCWVSESYGVKKPAKSLKIKVKADNSFKLETALSLLRN